MNFRSSRKINDGFSKRKRPNCEDLKTWRGLRVKVLHWPRGLRVDLDQLRGLAAKRINYILKFKVKNK
jgi:hypothetical protein